MKYLADLVTLASAAKLAGGAALLKAYQYIKAKLAAAKADAEKAAKDVEAKL